MVKKVSEKDLELHPEFGTNPTMGVCFWCGQDDGRIILLGKNGGEKAGERTLVDYEPCEKCQSCIEKGIFIIEARKNEPWRNGQQPMSKDGDDLVYPSGKWAVVTEDAIGDMFKGPVVDNILSERRTYLDTEAWKKLGFDTLSDTASG